MKIARHFNDVTVEKPYSLEAIKFYAVLRAINKHHGDYTAAAQELDINRATIYDVIKRRGNKTPKPKRKLALLAQAACLCLVALTGCATRETSNIQQQTVQRSTVLLPALAAAPVTNTNAPVGQSIPLSWDMSPGAAFEVFRVYASSNTVDWRPVAETANKFAVITNIFLPQWFVVRTVLGVEESEDSNRVGWLSNQTVVVVREVETANFTDWTTLKTTWLTNPPGNKFFGHQIETQTQRVIE